MKIEQNFGNIYLIELASENNSSEIRALFPGKKVCVCDLYVKNSQAGQVGPDGIMHYDDLLVIDHHAPIPLMRQNITSTVIANAYVKKNGSLGGDDPIVINHADADSILSSLIMSGRLSPEEDYALASIAADHSGEENTISDVLQSLEQDRDLEKSIDVLFKLLEKRYLVRKELKERVESGQFQWLGDIAYIVLEKRIDAALAPALLPDAKIILVACPHEKGPKAWRIRARLGINARGIALNELGLPDAGGRWDAISTGRHGGTDIDPEAYVKMVKKALEDKAPSQGESKE